VNGYKRRLENIKESLERAKIERGNQEKAKERMKISDRDVSNHFFVSHIFHSP